MNGRKINVKRQNRIQLDILIIFKSLATLETAETVGNLAELSLHSPPTVLFGSTCSITLAWLFAVVLNDFDDDNSF